MAMVQTIGRRRLVHWSLIVATGLITIAIASSQAAAQSCLPSDIKPSENVVSDPNKHDGAHKPTTVRDRLTELKARCRQGKLLDSRGKQIYFLRLIGCWGN